LEAEDRKLSRQQETNRRKYERLKKRKLLDEFTGNETPSISFANKNWVLPLVSVK
jgi:hypothetical protein